MHTKTCTQCKKSLLVQHFKEDPLYPDGYKDICRSCRRDIKLSNQERFMADVPAKQCNECGDLFSLESFYFSKHLYDQRANQDIHCSAVRKKAHGLPNRLSFAAQQIIAEIHLKPLTPATEDYAPDPSPEQLTFEPLDTVPDEIVVPPETVVPSTVSEPEGNQLATTIMWLSTSIIVASSVLAAVIVYLK